MQVAKLLEETLKKEAELTALLKLSAQDLWVRDLDTFTEKWEVSSSVNPIIKSFADRH